MRSPEDPRSRPAALRRLLIGIASAAVVAGTVGAPTGAAAAWLGRLSPARTMLTWHGGPFSGPLGLPGFSNPLPLVCVINIRS